MTRPLLSALVGLLIGGVLSTSGSDVKMSGLRFPVGGSPDAPSARVKIEHVAPGAQKIGFFRVSVLPQVVATGMEIRLQREDVGALAEISKTLGTLAKCEVQEFQKIAVFRGNERVPRLLIENAVPGKDAWSLKRVRVKTPLGFREVREATLHLSGDLCGACSSPETDAPLRIDWTAGSAPGAAEAAQLPR